MMVLLDWQTITVWLVQTPILTALSELNYTILEPTNGIMHPTIPLARELFIFNKIELYLTVYP